MKTAVSFAAPFTVLALASSLAGNAQAAPPNKPPPNFEYSPTSQANLRQINVTQALHTNFLNTYCGGSASGCPLTVAVLDGPADIAHVDLAGREAQHIVYNGIYNKSSDHATHVSGILGATQNNVGVVGVDPYAKLLSAPVFDQRHWVATDLGAAALTYVQGQNARVVNMSYGSTVKGDIFISGELDVLKNYPGMVLVRAAGNDGVIANSQAFGGDASTAFKNLLIVGSVSATNGISSFSITPGEACIGSCGANNQNEFKNFWLVAPGESILSDAAGSYWTMTGTSMATPQVAGAAALVLQRDPQLQPDQVATILKQSAHHLGNSAPGTPDAVYGWGLLDVAAALSPVGLTVVPTGATVDNGGVSAQGSGITTSSLVNTSSFEAALSGAIMLDGFNRAFVADIPTPHASAPAYATNFLEQFAGDVFLTTTELRNDGRSTLYLTARGEIANGGLGVVSMDTGNIHVASGLGNSVSYFTSVDGGVGGRKETFSHFMAREFFTGSGDAGLSLNQAMFVGADLQANSRLSLSGIYLRTTPASFAQVPGNVSAMMLGTQLTSSLVKVGANYRLMHGVTAGLSYGLLAEQGQTLGMRTAGALNLGDGMTHIAGANFSADIASATSISVFAEHSATQGYAGGKGPLSSNSWSGSKYGLSLTQSHAFGLDGLFRLTVARPWQVDTGALRIHLPVGRELDGRIDYEERLLSVAENGTPLEVALAYLQGDTAFKYGGEVRMVDHNIAGQGVSEFSLAGALRWSF